MARPAARVLDVREGELRITLASGIIIFFIVGGHTMLETARDALFLTKLPPRTLNLVYVAVAGLSFVVSGASAKTIQAVGRRRALILNDLVQNRPLRLPPLPRNCCGSYSRTVTPLAAGFPVVRRRPGGRHRQVAGRQPAAGSARSLESAASPAPVPSLAHALTHPP